MSFIVSIQNILLFLIGSNPPAPRGTHSRYVITQPILHNWLALAYLEAQ